MSLSWRFVSRPPMQVTFFGDTPVYRVYPRNSQRTTKVDDQKLDNWFVSYLINLQNMLWYIGFHPSVIVFKPDLDEIARKLPIETRHRLDEMMKLNLIDVSANSLGYPREWEELGSP